MRGYVDLLLTEPVVAAFSVSHAFLFVCRTTAHILYLALGGLRLGHPLCARRVRTQSPSLILTKRTDGLCLGRSRRRSGRSTISTLDRQAQYSLR